MGDPHRHHRQRQRLGDLRAARRRSAGGLVADRHQHRRQQVFPRQDGLAGARDAAWRSWCIAWWTPSPIGARRTATSRPPQDGENFRDRTGAPDADAEGVLQFAGLVQRGVKESRGYGWYYDEATQTRSRSWSRARRGRSARPASSIRWAIRSNRFSIWRRPKACCSSGARARAPIFRRCAKRTRILSGGGRASGPLSFMKGFDAFAGVIKSRRQDAARGQDGDPERRSSRYRELHLVQGEGREEGPHADRRGLRFLARRRRLQLHLLPERQQFRARHRRVHGSGGRTIGDWWTKSRVNGQPVKRYKARDLMRADRRSHAPVRRSRHAVRYHHQPLAHVARTRRASMRRIPARNTCSWTIRPAIWRR